MASLLKISDIIQVVNDGGEIPTLAPVMRNVIKACSNDRCKNEDLVEIAKRDIALTSHLIRAANDPNRFKSTVKDVKSAVKRLGLKTSKNIILATEFIDRSENREFYNSFQWLWDRNLFNSVGADVFSELSKPKSKVSYSSIGIMLDIGVWFMLHHFPNQYKAILDRCGRHGGALYEFETEEFGFDHTIIGQTLVREWHLGDDVESAIRYHHSEIEGDFDFDPSVLNLAQLATGFFFENRFAHGFEPLEQFAKKQFNVESEKLRKILQEISFEAESTSVKIARSWDDELPYVELLRSINMELGRATLSYDQMVRELEVAKLKAESLARELKEVNVKLRDASNHDPLTKVYNRRYFNEFLEWNFKRAERYNSTLGAMMVDIDFFKKVNDTYGHLTGDQVLQNVASTLQESLRNTDVVARFGGEEFVVLLPETDAEAVMFTAERIRESVEKSEFKHGKDTIHITVSIGHVAFSKKECPSIRSYQDLVQSTDENMYKAKTNGRNQIYPPMDSAEKHSG